MNSREEKARIELLRHTLATLAYRGAKAMRGAAAGFAEFRAGKTTRRAVEIVSHMADLMEWSCSGADGPAVWREGKPTSWEKEVSRFFSGLKKFDRRLKTGKKLAHSAEKFFQGPIADALTHVGQLATLRRLAGSGVRGENYFVAKIRIGRVGRKQAKVVREFD